MEGSFGLWRAVMISEVKISHMEGSFDMWREQSLVWGGRESLVGGSNCM